MHRRASPGRHRRPRDDGGQLLLLAGIILILAFTVTSLSLGRLADLEKQTLAEQKNPIIQEYALLRATIARTLDDVTTVSTPLDQFYEIFDTTAESVRQIEQKKGYEVLVLRASKASNVPYHEEFFLRAQGDQYQTQFVSEDGTVDLGDVAYDGTPDGVIWVSTGCKVGNGACVQAALGYVYLSDGITQIQETVLFPVNNG